MIKFQPLKNKLGVFADTEFFIFAPMKQLVWLSLFVLVLFGCSSSGDNTYRQNMIKIRKEKNKEFADAKKSPLLSKDVESFVGLQYYPIDSTYKIQAELRVVPAPKTIEMPTTTERAPLYFEYGSAIFTLNDTLCSLVVYQEVEEPEVLFIPFNDYTNGAGSYGGGRYLDLELKEVKGDQITLDFNKAYNPYCAYNYNYSCPVPPDTNMLNVSILAGEKSYKH